MNVPRVVMNQYIHSNSNQYFAFNIWSIETAKAVIDAAAKVNKDVILQTSMKAFEALDKEEVRKFVTSYSRKRSIRAYLHLDHCRHIDAIQKAAELGWDSVMIDASDRPLKENIRVTGEVCAAVKGKGILVEAEIGQIGGTEEGISSREAGIARIEDIKVFLQNTAVDMLAVAVGTAHGLYQGRPNLHYELIEKTALLSDMPLVIHGGTGLTEEMFLKLLSYRNIKKINISTDVKQAYRRGIEESARKGYLEEKGFDPLKVEKVIHDSIENMAENKLKLLVDR